MIDPMPSENDYQDEQKFTKESLAANFSNNRKMKVVFKKKNGDMRTMICTNNREVIPEEFRVDTSKKAGKPARPTPDHLFPVFDLEANGQRSFTIANVISVEAIA